MVVIFKSLWYATISGVGSKPINLIFFVLTDIGQKCVQLRKFRLPLGHVILFFPRHAAGMDSEGRRLASREKHPLILLSLRRTEADLRTALSLISLYSTLFHQAQRRGNPLRPASVRVKLSSEHLDP